MAVASPTQRRTLHAVPTAAFAAWFEALYRRHTQTLRFAEIRRALQALSMLYVHQRDKLAAGLALASPGKRAAFALYYAPLHGLLTQAIVQALGCRRPAALLDLGCGSGAAALGWALSSDAPLRLRGIDSNGYVLQEARWNWQHIGQPFSLQRGDLRGVALRPGEAVVLSYVLNELPEGLRARWQERLLADPSRQALILEPVAGRVAPWFPDWERALLAAGGQSHLWTVRMEMPDKLRLLDRAAGLNHRDFKVRSLYLPGGERAAHCRSAPSPR